ncbi:transmembrane protein 222-like isoform X2 [Paramormyrops kingsleyae]|uniref:Transmembrane protein 222a n=1 Tax=Paramormyrops kingsleyae TaxID=1676925 RepID=A0A3B3SYY3_9TELE|nr:transmembrane protein 222-like isoform X2 [Paramormyrops kingsleyae]
MMADASEADALTNDKEDCEKIDPDKSRFPYCIVWTPIPGLSWLLPFIGHMGICTSSGVIRDFAGPYCVSEDDMAFGRPTKYWRLDVSKVCGGSPEVWDAAVRDASQQYGHKMHILCCDNCHSYVALALNLMRYDGSSTWNMINLCLLSLLHSKHVSIADSLKTWLPFLLLYGVIITVTVVLNVR